MQAFGFRGAGRFVEVSNGLFDTAGDLRDCGHARASSIQPQGRQTADLSREGSTRRDSEDAAPTFALGIVHPSAILQGSYGDEPFQIIYLKRAKRVLEGAEPLIPDFSLPAPNTNQYPTLHELIDFGKGCDSSGITLDIENAGNALVMVGITRHTDYHKVQVWFRQEGGDPWVHGDPDQFDSVVEWFALLLADRRIPKCAHNGQAHDWILLARIGFIINNIDFDTLLAAHIRMPEMRKGLEPLSAALLGISGWKKLLGTRKKDAEEDDQGDFK